MDIIEILENAKLNIRNAQRQKVNLFYDLAIEQIDSVIKQIELKEDEKENRNAEETS